MVSGLGRKVQNDSAVASSSRLSRGISEAGIVSNWVLVSGEHRGLSRDLKRLKAQMV